VEIFDERSKYMADLRWIEILRVQHGLFDPRVERGGCKSVDSIGIWSIGFGNDDEHILLFLVNSVIS